ncbi:VOC family protein [Anaerosporobacter faecicola]|uniref:VOC family protein n=1 Tax=Anaerosporobacter faecicola TaxID=2718714 RepID=UPI001438DB2E|nr:VOC family protein [Anaerosporobacter faecicola]
MIKQISKITIYVSDQHKAKQFWLDQMDFQIIVEQPMGPTMTWLEVAPNKASSTSFVLYEKEWMKQQNPENPLTHPSLILSTDDIQTTYNTLKERGVDIKELMDMPYGKMFTFYDPDHNAYLIREH